MYLVNEMFHEATFLGQEVKNRFLEVSRYKVWNIYIKKFYPRPFCTLRNCPEELGYT
jgi:hypothetical protein